MHPLTFLVLLVLVGAAAPVSDSSAQCSSSACGPAGTPCATTSAFGHLPDKGFLVGTGPLALGAATPEEPLAYRVIVRDFAGTRLANVPVTLDFSATTSTTNGSAIQDPGTVVNCAAGVATLTRMTNESGLAVFYPKFCGSTLGVANVAILAGGVCLGNTSAKSTDSICQYGAGFEKCELADFAAFADCYLAAFPNCLDQRFEYGLQLGTLIEDYAIFAYDYIGAGSLTGTHYCPAAGGW